MKFRRNAPLDISQVIDLRNVNTRRDYRPAQTLYNGPHLVPVPVRHPQTGHVMGIVHVDLRDPFGLGRQIDHRNMRPPVVVPPMHSGRVIYTSPRVRQQAQIERHHHGR